MKASRRSFLACVLGARTRPGAHDGAAAEKAFAEGRLAAALSLARETLDRNPESVTAWLVAARAYHASYRDGPAAEAYGRALALAPGDPKVLLHAGELAPAERQRDLLARLARMRLPGPQYELARARLDILDRLEGRRMFAADPLPGASGIELHRLRMERDQIYQAGVVARVNGARPRTFLLASGAEPGMYGTRQGQYGFADTLECGGITVRNVLTFVSAGLPFEWWDGIMGTATFRDLLIRLDLPSFAATFEPLAGTQLKNGLHAVRSRHLLLVPGGTRKTTGYVLPQLQSEETVIDGSARDLTFRRDAELAFRRHGTGFSCRDFCHMAEPEYGVGSDYRSETVAVCDLSETSSKVGFRVVGVLGYRFMMSTVISIDYRNGIMDFQPANPG